MKIPRSHYVPRTTRGRVAVAAFLGLFAFTQPPLVFWLANRTDPWIAGVPFLYAYLFLFYCALIGLLLWVAGSERKQPHWRETPTEREGG